MDESDVRELLSAVIGGLAVLGLIALTLAVPG